MLSFLTRLPRYAKTVLLVAVDALLGGVALSAAMIARAGKIPNIGIEHMAVATMFVMALVPAVAICCGMYRSVIRFHTPGLPIKAATVGMLSGSGIALLGWFGGSPFKALGLGVVFALTLFALLLLSRYAARWLLRPHLSGEGVRVAVYGAGAAGRQLVALMRQTQHKPVVFIDDDPALQDRVVADLPVIASDKKLAKRLADKKVNEIFLAIPSAGPTRRREILELLGDLPYRVRTVPSLDELGKGQPHALADVREISDADLLGRDLVLPVPGLLEKCITAKVVLITGGGGSIGAELCRQVLALRPARLIILEHAEFALYQIEQELRKLHSLTASESELVFLLGSVMDRQIVAGVFDQHRIDTVYHAAAYKHVPIVENNALEGMRNNVLGTWYVAQTAARKAVKHFILISSDKAVRPTNVMGATKRMAELMLQSYADRFPKTVFSMVRFGNVLGSSGSVVPLFRAQIEAGGPITLTHPDVTRYFMTIAEAVQLVIQAGAMAHGGEVFVLDMGHPVRIKDLALRMIRLSGKSVRDQQNPLGDIAIEVVGLRPGEKLFEELLIAGEATGTGHPRIWQIREAAADPLAFEQELIALERRLNENPAAVDVRRLLSRWVTGYGNPDLLQSRTRMDTQPEGVLDSSVIDTSVAVSRPA